MKKDWSVIQNTPHILYGIGKFIMIPTTAHNKH